MQTRRSFFARFSVFLAAIPLARKVAISKELPKPTPEPRWERTYHPIYSDLPIGWHRDWRPNP